MHLKVTYPKMNPTSIIGMVKHTFPSSLTGVPSLPIVDMEKELCTPNKLPTYITTNMLKPRIYQLTLKTSCKKCLSVGFM